LNELYVGQIDLTEVRAIEIGMPEIFVGEASPYLVNLGNISFK
jgi:hypothetical protein